MSKHHGRRRNPLLRRLARAKKAARAAGARPSRMGSRFGLGHGLERLEDRVVLSSNPVLTFITPSPAEADEVQVSFEFTDSVTTGGSESIGLDPNDAAFTSFGAFDPATNIVINTTTLTMTGTSQLGNTVTLDAGYGAFQAAVFVFDTFELDAGRTITATGSRPLVLLSKDSMTINGIIDVSANGITAGAGGGNGGNTSAPAFHGKPAAGAPNNLINPNDPTNGHGRNQGSNQGGGGAGFGGAGGGGTYSDTTGFGPSLSGGASYGNLAVAIQGGSGGAAGFTNVPSFRMAVGGGGGGGVELGAVGSITVNGSILANGANGSNDTAFSGNAAGGGGAGGGILIHATSVTVGASGVLSARGGDGFGSFPTSHGGGGGGGGRVLIAHDATISGSYVNAGTVDVAGGADFSMHSTPGGAGSFLVEGVSPAAVVESYSFTINWGDGSPLTTGTYADGDITLDPDPPAGPNVTGSFSASHTYADDGEYTITVTVTDDQGTATEVFLAAVANVAPTLAISGAAGVDEGNVYTLNLSSFDPGDDVITSWTIDWGDSVEVVVGNPSSVTHTYADGDNNYEISAFATDEDGDFAAAATVAVLVANVAPVVSISGSSETEEGELYALNLSSMDQGDDAITSWTINWGDGAVEVITGNPASVTHTYADGDAIYTITATATDEDGTYAASGDVEVTVANVAPTLTISGDSTVDEGSVYTLNLSSFDPGDDTITSWTINWGDSVEIVAGNPASVTHTYADGDASYTITAAATDEDGTFVATGDVEVTVANVAPTLTVSGDATVAEGSVYTLNLSSSDPGDDAITSWTIDWGDSVEVIAGNPASVTHIYADGDASYTITATATDEDGTYTATASVLVVNVDPTITSLTTSASGLGAVIEGQTVTLSAQFADVAADTHSAVIDWGDGVTTAGTVDQLLDQVAGSHVYATGGFYTVTVTVTDDDGGVATATVGTVIAGVNLQGGVVQAIGTNNDDVLTVSMSGSSLKVVLALGGGPTITKTYAYASVNSLEAYLAGGKDTGVVNSNVNTPAMIDGGDGNDKLTAGNGNTVLYGGAGDDVLKGGNGANQLFGGDGNDSLTGGNGGDYLDGGAGNDVLHGGNANDVLIGGDGDDSINGGNGDDFIDAGDGNNVVSGGNGDDVIWAGAGNDVIDGGNGNDFIDAGDGNNVVSGGNGDDVIWAGAGNDVIVGGNGNDYLFGGGGNDVISGDNGDDVIVGGDGDDVITGGNGNDLMIGGAGSDSIVAGNGDDIVVTGFTSFDADLAALNAIMAEWTSGHSYAQRVANLTEQGTNSGAGNRLNGAIFLVADDANPSNVTVFDDDDVDCVEGNNGLDLFFASLDEESAEDWIFDLKHNELVEMI